MTSAPELYEALIEIWRITRSKDELDGITIQEIAERALAKAGDNHDDPRYAEIEVVRGAISGNGEVDAQDPERLSGHDQTHGWTVPQVALAESARAAEGAPFDQSRQGVGTAKVQAGHALPAETGGSGSPALAGEDESLLSLRAVAASIPWDFGVSGDAYGARLWVSRIEGLHTHLRIINDYLPEEAEWLRGQMRDAMTEAEGYIRDWCPASVDGRRMAETEGLGSEGPTSAVPPEEAGDAQ